MWEGAPAARDIEYDALCLLSGMPPLIASPADWTRQLSELSGGTIKPRGVSRLYLRFLASLLSGLIFSCDLAAPLATASKCLVTMRGGTANPSAKFMRTSTSMAGVGRMSSLVDLIQRIASDHVPGGYLEAGVWRGGMSILATAALQLSGLGSRSIYLADSFQGLPMPRKGSLGKGETFYATNMNRTLAVGAARVLANFDRFSVDRSQVSMVPGYFVDSLPKLRAELQARGERLSILRMDGDMYDSTADILYNLYDLVAVGGFVIIDDFGWTSGIRAPRGIPAKLLGTPAERKEAWPFFGAKRALLDFRALHGIEDGQHTLINIDGTGAYFKKAREVPVQRDRYLHGLQTAYYRQLRPPQPLTVRDYHNLTLTWNRAVTVAEEERMRAASLSLGSFRDDGTVCNEMCKGAPQSASSGA